MRDRLRHAVFVLCVVGLWLAGERHAHAEFAWSDLWSALDPSASDDDDIHKRSTPLEWSIGGHRPEQVLYFAGFDAQRFSAGSYAGAVWSPLSGTDGLLLRVFAADGIDSFRTPDKIFISESMRAAAMAGYRINRSGFELSAYAGVEALARVYFPISRATRLQPQGGVRLAADLWWQPLDAVMVAANLSMTTIEASFYGRIAGGVRILDVWAGPEISASTDLFGEQYRVGAHVTGLRYGPYEFSAAAGYGFDSFGRGSAYGRLGFTLREIDPMTIMP